MELVNSNTNNEHLRMDQWSSTDLAQTFLDYLEENSTFSTSPNDYGDVESDIFLGFSEENYPVKTEGKNPTEYNIIRSELESHSNDLQIQILGVPPKSRVETQLKLCIQLVDQNGIAVESWKHLEIPKHLLATTSSKANEDVAPKKENVLSLEAGVICSSNPSKVVLRCLGCTQRERKNKQRKKKNVNNRETNVEKEDTIEEEQKKILLVHTSPVVDFSHGEAIVPSRITCYCRHHDEKKGFQIWVNLRASNGKILASGLSSPVMITDDHKSAKKSGAKRQKQEEIKEELSATITKVIPTEGPISGGIDVTILGENFPYDAICMFGEKEAATQSWGSKTLLAVLPPSLFPETVPVTLKNYSNEDQEPVIFTYRDDSDRMMLELALQVIGMKLTGKIDDARMIAMNIVNNNQDTIQKALKGSSHQSVSDSVLTALKNTSKIQNTNLLDLSRQNDRGDTLLILAVLQGNHRLVKFLMQHSSKLIGVQNKLGNTALHYAVMYGYQGMVKLILNEDREKANLKLQNNAGFTPLHLAKRFKYQNIEKQLETNQELPSILSPTPPSRTIYRNLRSKFFNFLDSEPLLPMTKQNEGDNQTNLEKGVKPLPYPRFSGFMSHFKTYRALIVVAVAIMLGGLVIAGTGRNVAITSSRNTISEQNQNAEYGENVKEEESHSLVQGIILSAYYLCSIAVIGALIHRHRRTWKMKITCSLLSLLLLLTIFVQWLFFF